MFYTLTNFNYCVNYFLYPAIHMLEGHGSGDEAQAEVGKRGEFRRVKQMDRAVFLSIINMHTCSITM